MRRDPTNLIDPIALHQDSHGEAGPIMARACHTFELGDWRRRRREAEAGNDFYTLDRLDREYDMIGLP